MSDEYSDELDFGREAHDDGGWIRKAVASDRVV